MNSKNNNVQSAEKNKFIKNFFLKKDKNFYMSILLSPLSAINSMLIAYESELFSKIIFDNKKDLLPRAIFLLLVLIIGILILRICFIYFTNTYKKNWYLYMNNNLMEEILNKTPNDFLKRDRAHYITLFNKDLDFIYDNYVNLFFNFIEDSLIMISATIYCMRINVFISFLILVSGVILLLITRYFSNVANDNNYDLLDQQKSYNESLNDGIYGYLTLYRTSKENNFLNYFRKKTDILETKRQKAAKSSSYLRSMANHVNICIQVSLNFVAVILILHNKLDPVYFPVLVSLTHMMIYPMELLANSVGNMRASRKVREKYIDLVYNNTNSHELLESLDDSENNLAIEFNNLSFSYGDRKIFDNISFNIKKNEHVLLDGKSGSGKSTIFKLLSKVESEYEGEIFVNSKNIKAISKDKLFNEVGVISQNPYIFRASIMQNIVVFEDEDDIDFEKLNSVIDKSGLRDLVSSLKNGYRDYLLDAGSNLSGGEKQRIEIARALYSDKKILLIDEATSSLDLDKAYDLENLFKSLDITIISVCHRKDISYDELYDRILYIRDGKIYEL